MVFQCNVQKEGEGTHLADCASIPGTLPTALPKLSYLTFMTNQQDNHVCSIILTLHLRKLMLKDGWPNQSHVDVWKLGLNLGSVRTRNLCFNSFVLFSLFGTLKCPLF